MEEGSSAERWIAVEAFGLMGVVAREKHAVKISARLEDESNFVRRSALKIMRQLRETELWPFARNLARRVDDEDVEIRRAGREAVGRHQGEAGIARDGTGLRTDEVEAARSEAGQEGLRAHEIEGGQARIEQHGDPDGAVRRDRLRRNRVRRVCRAGGLRRTERPDQGGGECRGDEIPAASLRRGHGRAGPVTGTRPRRGRRCPRTAIPAGWPA